MKTPSLDEMKLAVAKILPDVLTDPGLGSGPGNLEIYWEEDSVLDAEPVKDREWLHVCWLAEQKLTEAERRRYLRIIGLELVASHNTDHYVALWRGTTAGFLVRLEALCRVKCPEMFIESTI